MLALITWLTHLYTVDHLSNLALRRVFRGLQHATAIFLEQSLDHLSFSHCTNAFAARKRNQKVFDFLVVVQTETCRRRSAIAPSKHCKHLQAEASP